LVITIARMVGGLVVVIVWGRKGAPLPETVIPQVP